MEEIRNKRKFEFENDDYKEIDINSILNIFLRNKKVISITSLAGTLLGIIYSLIQNPIYIGRFQVVVDTKGEQKISSQSQSISELISGEISNTLKTQELILNSPSVLKPVYKYAKAKYAEEMIPNKTGFQMECDNIRY